MEGCCLTCEEAEEGCLCFDCNCRKCERYNDEGKCQTAQENKSDNWNLRVEIKDDGWITIKFNGPIRKDDYAKIKPFIKQYFRWDRQFQEYETFSEDEEFVDLFTKKLEDCDFDNWDFISSDSKNKKEN
jgi:hypothetical protein